MSRGRENIVAICSAVRLPNTGLFALGCPHKPRARCIHVIRQRDPACLQVTCMGSMKELMNDLVNDRRKCPLS